MVIVVMNSHSHPNKLQDFSNFITNLKVYYLLPNEQNLTFEISTSPNFTFFHSNFGDTL